MDWTGIFGLKIILGLSGLAIWGVGAVISARLDQKAARWVSIVVTLLLLGVATASVGNYYKWDPDRFWNAADTWDLTHYFVNTKYFSELGYDRLYYCVLAANADDGGQFRRFKKIRRMTDYRHRPATEFLAKRAICDDAFTPERWAQFRQDLAEMRPSVGRRTWHHILGDHGYNGPPTQALLGRVQHAAVPASKRHVVAKLDVLWVILAVGVVAWAYGPQPAVLLLIAIFTMWPTRWPIFGGTVLRFDWLALLLASVAMLRRERWTLAGVLLALSTLLRLFPLFFGMVLVVKALRSVDWRRGVPLRERIPPKWLRFFGAMLITIVGLTGVTAAAGGISQYGIWAGKIAQHAAPEHINFTRIGYALAGSYRGEMYDPRKVMGKDKPGLYTGKLDPDRKRPDRKWWPKKLSFIKGQSGWLPPLALLILGLLGLGIRRVPDDRVLMLGFVPLFCMTVAHPFFYVMLAVPIVVLAAERSWAGTVSLALLFGVNALAHWLEAEPYFRYSICALYSVVLTVFCLWETGRVVLGGWKARQQPKTRTEDDAEVAAEAGVA